MDPISGALMGLNGWLGPHRLAVALPSRRRTGQSCLAWRSYVICPIGPKDAAWLKPEQRKWLCERLAM